MDEGSLSDEGVDLLREIYLIPLGMFAAGSFLLALCYRSLDRSTPLALALGGRAPSVQPTVVAEIDALVVHSSFRRQHIATRLVEAAILWADDSGAARTELGVYEFNETARAFWHSVGFQTLSRRLVLHSKPET